jgi:hypothetical protein
MLLGRAMMSFSYVVVMFSKRFIALRDRCHQEESMRHGRAILFQGLAMTGALGYLPLRANQAQFMYVNFEMDPYTLTDLWIDLGSTRTKPFIQCSPRPDNFVDLATPANSHGLSR